MDRITVKLGSRSYPITIASGLFNDPDAFWPLFSGDIAMLVTNDCLASIYMDPICELLTNIGIKIDRIVLPDGEWNKSLDILEKIFTALITKLHDRSTTLIALGGGVIGDLTGFAAASYKRGVRFIQAPTTLLSQVDSSIGGKTAINHVLGKNMIGTFYQPASVVIDLDCLNTLPRRELSSGLAEVIKYGIILDASFFVWLEENIDLILALDIKALEYCVRRCCELKASLVSKDEYDYGQRVLLNLGHTYSHAIEAHMGYGNWLHGEAVAAGIMMAVHAARHFNKFSDVDSERIRVLLQRAGLPVNGPAEMIPEDYLPYMMRDKKIITDQLCLVLPVKLGYAKIYLDISSSIVLASIKDSQI